MSVAVANGDDVRSLKFSTTGVLKLPANLFTYVCRAGFVVKAFSVSHAARARELD